MQKIRINRDTDALIIVDLQNDFCPGGALAVPDGDIIVRVVNSLVPYFKKVYATQDWHPANHISFKEQGGVWPPHCIAGTTGAQLHPELQAGKAIRIHKGTDPEREAYSGFQGTNLTEILTSARIERLVLCGLATDYCVRATALDAIGNNFKVVIIADAVKGVDVKLGDSQKALEELVLTGVRIAYFNTIA